eukprot:1142849-Pelagomonas_calceolata.AAC.10
MLPLHSPGLHWLDYGRALHLHSRCVCPARLSGSVGECSISPASLHYVWDYLEKVVAFYCARVIMELLYSCQLQTLVIPLSSEGRMNPSNLLMRLVFSQAHFDLLQSPMNIGFFIYR